MKAGAVFSIFVLLEFSATPDINVPSKCLLLYWITLLRFWSNFSKGDVSSLLFSFQKQAARLHTSTFPHHNAQDLGCRAGHPSPRTCSLTLGPYASSQAFLLGKKSHEKSTDSPSLLQIRWLHPSGIRKCHFLRFIGQDCVSSHNNLFSIK